MGVGKHHHVVSNQVGRQQGTGVLWQVLYKGKEGLCWAQKSWLLCNHRTEEDRENRGLMTFFQEAEVRMRETVESSEPRLHQEAPARLQLAPGMQPSFGRSSTRKKHFSQMKAEEMLPHDFRASASLHPRVHHLSSQQQGEITL